MVLQARPDAGASWKVVARAIVARSGAYQLTWKPKKNMARLRVVLESHKGFAGSAARVPKAAISNCRVSQRAGGWAIRCDTTMKDDSRVRLMKNGKVVGFARVRDGSLRLQGTGTVGAYVIDITAGKRHVRLDL